MAAIAVDAILASFPRLKRQVALSVLARLSSSPPLGG